MLKYLLKRLLTIICYGSKCKIESRTIILGVCEFEGNNTVCRGAYLRDVFLGYASSIGSESYFTKSKIGRYTSIGDNVKCISATHPLEPYASTHPFFYRKSKTNKQVTNNIFDEYITLDEGLSVCIGNDVWVGSNVLIKGGVRIGDGAIIGMGSVVTKNVEPYSIVGGVPAQLIRFRFSNDQRTKLIELQWWNKSKKWISEHSEYFSNIDILLENTE